MSTLDELKRKIAYLKRFLASYELPPDDIPKAFKQKRNESVEPHWGNPDPLAWRKKKH